MAGNLLGTVLFLLGCLLILVNGLAVVKTIQNRRRGAHKHVSAIPLIPQLLMIFASLSFNTAARPWLPIGLPLVLAAADPGLWRLLKIILKAARSRPGESRE